MPIVGNKIETTSDNFGRMVKNDCLLIDKTMMIKDFLEGKDSSLILRPRRSGKSLNVSMLYYFLSSEVAGESTSGLFDNLAIAKENKGQFIKEHQGKYSVISITFKDVKNSTYAEAIEKIHVLVMGLYREHKKMLLSEKLDEEDKKLFKKYLSETISQAELEQSLYVLSEFLFKVYEKKVIILIDEYDSPLTNAYQYKFLEPLSLFLRNMFSSALKGNPFIEKGLMTGILRVSKNELLSGLNNVEIYSLFDTNYDQYFGFTEEEVVDLTNKIGSDHSLEEIKQFYNGYHFGDKVIYNPWSLMHYLDKKELSPYWVLTSGDKLLKELFIKSDVEIKDKLSMLMQGEVITGRISLKTSYEDLMESPDALWTLLLFSGYLTIESKIQDNDTVIGQLRIPNKEILAQYKGIFNAWLSEALGEKRYHSFLTSLLAGDVSAFTETLGSYLMDSLSFRDVAGEKKAENFYHGFVAGLIASVGDTHWVDSNKESGRGLYDIMLTPKSNQNTRGLILEFKHAKKIDLIEDEAMKALTQINKLQYVTELKRYPHITQILKVGLAFSGKEVISVYQEENLKTKKRSELVFSSRYFRDELEG